MFSISHLTMHPILSTSYVVPGLLLNPILFLYGINTILSRILPPISIDAAIQPAPYYSRGPSAEHPHLDIHASESLCWSYTAFNVCANLAAFGRVSEHRQARKERARLKRERNLKAKADGEAKLINGNGYHPNGGATLNKGSSNGSTSSKSRSRDATRMDDKYPSTTDSEIML